MKRYLLMCNAVSPWLAVVALALSIGTLQKERKTRHRVEEYVRERSETLRKVPGLVADARYTEEELDELRGRIEALREGMEKLEGRR
jgi:hypothetical protein